MSVRRRKVQERLGRELVVERAAHEYTKKLVYLKDDALRAVVVERDKLRTELNACRRELRELRDRQTTVEQAYEQTPVPLGDWLTQGLKRLGLWESPPPPRCEIAGIPFVVVTDPNLPPDQIELRDTKGNILRVINVGGGSIDSQGNFTGTIKPEVSK